VLDLLGGGLFVSYDPWISRKGSTYVVLLLPLLSTTSQSENKVKGGLLLNV
jgi:hypothetical protein